MSDNEASTKPTIETILERIDASRTDIEGRIDALRTDMEGRVEALRTDIEKRFDDLNIRFDRIESVTYSTRGEFVEMRADFREFRAQFK
jgi:hypothetical protein